MPCQKNGVASHFKGTFVQLAVFFLCPNCHSFIQAVHNIQTSRPSTSDRTYSVLTGNAKNSAENGGAKHPMMELTYCLLERAGCRACAHACVQKGFGRIPFSTNVNICEV